MPDGSGDFVSRDVRDQMLPLAGEARETVRSWDERNGGGDPLDDDLLTVIEQAAFSALQRYHKAAFEPLRAAVEALYYAAYWSPDRPCDTAALWAAVRDAARLPAGQSHERLGEQRTAADEGERYFLEGEQAIIANSFRTTLAHLGIQTSVALKATGMEDAKAMNVPVGEMLRAASILAVAIARRELKREPNPALWRDTAARFFAEAIDSVDVEDRQDEADAPMVKKIIDDTLREAERLGGMTHPGMGGGDIPLLMIAPSALRRAVSLALTGEAEAA